MKNKIDRFNQNATIKSARDQIRDGKKQTKKLDDVMYSLMCVFQFLIRGFLRYNIDKMKVQYFL